MSKRSDQPKLKRKFRFLQNLSKTHKAVFAISISAIITVTTIILITKEKTGCGVFSRIIDSEEGEGSSKIVEQSGKTEESFPDNENSSTQQTNGQSAENKNTAVFQEKIDQNIEEIEEKEPTQDTFSISCPELIDPKTKKPPVEIFDQTAGYNIDSGNWAAYPDEIVPVKGDPNNLLVLVNKKFQLPSDYEPDDLVDLGSTGIPGSSGKLGRKVIIEQLTALGEAAEKDGIDLAIKSAYRSYNTQVSTYNYWVSVEDGNSAKADEYSARPGHSQHQLGTTIDFTSPECNYCIGNEFSNTKASRWLSNNARKYGFVISYPNEGEFFTGYQAESWHYRFIGVENAVCHRDSNLVLDLWLFWVQ